MVVQLYEAAQEAEKTVLPRETKKSNKFSTLRD